MFPPNKHLLTNKHLNTPPSPHTLTHYNCFFILTLSACNLSTHTLSMIRNSFVRLVRRRQRCQSRQQQQQQRQRFRERQCRRRCNTRRRTLAAVRWSAVDVPSQHSSSTPPNTWWNRARRAWSWPSTKRAVLANPVLVATMPTATTPIAVAAALVWLLQAIPPQQLGRVWNRVAPRVQLRNNILDSNRALAVDRPLRS